MRPLTPPLRIDEEVQAAVVEQHGGRLSVSETPGGGATFAVDLPVAAVPPAAPVRRCVPVPRAHTRQALVVDDEPELAKLVREVLQADGFVVDVVASGREARTRLETREFDAILCDLRMPDVDGPALHSWLLEARPTLASRVLFVTGDTLGPSARRFLAAAGQPVLEKPFLPADLRRAVAELLARAGPC